MGCGGALADALGPIRGRGAAHNPRNRFESIEYEIEPEALEEDTGRPKTAFFSDRTRSVLSRNDSPDLGMGVNLSTYRGCEHGCAYCYARPSHEYLGFSAGLDFETKIVVKENAPQLLRQELASRHWRPQTVGVSGATDVYQPAERIFRLTRRCLEVFRDFRNPVAIITKNRLVARDIDLLKEMSAYNGVAVYVSVTTLDLELNRKLEPRTSSPAQRIETIRTLSEAGIPVGTMVAPVIPGLTDSEVLPIIRAVTEAGARFAGYVMLRLPYAVAPLFEQWLAHHYPGRKDKVLNRIREMRGGELYRAEFGKRMRGEGFHADQVAHSFEVACRKAGIHGNRPGLSSDQFRVPQGKGDQMSLW
jgi:DNA repair photolyase